MRKVIVSEFVTLDGVMEAPGGEEAFDLGGWSFPYFDDEYLKYKHDELMDAGALLLGRVTYEGFAAAWPGRDDANIVADAVDAGGSGDASEADGMSARMNSLPKYVASTTLQTVKWNNSHLLQGDVADAVRKLKAEPGQDILVSGSAELVYTLMAHDLVDEYRMMVHPVVLGRGKRIYPTAPGVKKLALKEMRALASGIVILVYTPAE